MFRFLIFIFLFVYLNLEASPEKSCYSVELLSHPQNSSLTMKAYPDTCLKMSIGKFDVVRCSCYEKYSEAKTLLAKHKINFDKAHIVKTYKSRFSSTNLKTKKIEKESTPLKKITPLVFQNRVDIFKGRYDFFDFNTTLEDEEDIQLFDSMKYQLENNRDLQLSKLDNSITLYGLSLDAKYDQYLNRDYLNREYTDYESNIKLKYDLFKNGFMQQRKSNRESKNRITTTFYHSSSNLEKYTYEEKLSNITTLLPLVNFHYFEMLTKITEEDLEKNNLLYNLGCVAKYEIQLKEKILNKYKNNSKRYQESIEIKLPKTYLSLLQSIETLHLEEIDVVKEYMRTNNSDLLLQESKLDSLNSSNSYFDNVKVNVYVSNRTMDENGWYNTIGVDSHFPLDFSSYRKNELEKLEQNAISNQEEALKKFLDNRLDKLYREFKNYQYKIQNTQEEIEIQNYQLQRYKLLEKDNISSLHLDIHEKIYQQQKSILKLRYEISLSKLELLKVIIQIEYIINNSDLNLIIKANKCL